MKKFITYFFATILVFAFTSFNVSAESTVEEGSMPKDETIITSEGDVIKLWLSSTDDELRAMGYSDSEILEIRSYNFEEMFLERANFPEQKLQNFGYTNHQIEILRNYEGETITANSAVLAATSDMTLTFFKNHNTSSSKGVYVDAFWSWDIVPMIKLSDLFVVTWQGVNSSGYTVDLTPSVKNGYIYYYKLTTGQYDHVSTATGTFDSIKKAVSLNIPMVKNDNYYWAKEGVVQLKLVPPSNGSISYINLGSGYGHKTVSASVSYSVSTSLGIGFTPTLSIKSTGARTGRVYSNGTVTNN